MPKQPLWTPEDDAELMASYGIKSNLDLATCLNRSEQAIKTRAYSLGITGQICPDSETGERETFRGDQAFVTAMTRAIRAGLERPPQIGIDKRPCTKSPREFAP
jgi:hypothetical protein